MAVAEKNTKQKAGVKRRRGQYPSKRTINLAALSETNPHMGLAIPAIILILIAAAIFSKFLVIDRLAEVNAAQHEVNEIQNKLDAGYRELDDFDDLSELYAHYTYSGFTKEELTRTDRADALRLIRSVVLPRAEISSWTLSGNRLSIILSAETLQEVNLLVQQLEADDLVDFCTVNTANTTDNVRRVETDELGAVRARVLAYLNTGTEVDNR